MVEKRKKYSIFDFLKNLTIDKVPWSKYSEYEQKDFSGFMAQLWLSMNYDLIEFVNSLQPYLSQLDKENFYKLYYNILPQENIYISFVKGKKTEKIDPALILLLSSYFEISKDQAEEYVMLFNKTDEGKESLKVILQRYGKTDKEIKKLTTIKV